MTDNPSWLSCLVCGATVEDPEYTLLCDECEKAELDYVEEQR